MALLARFVSGGKVYLRCCACGVASPCSACSASTIQRLRAPRSCGLCRRAPAAGHWGNAAAAPAATARRCACPPCHRRAASAAPGRGEMIRKGSVGREEGGEPPIRRRPDRAADRRIVDVQAGIAAILDIPGPGIVTGRQPEQACDRRHEPAGQNPLCPGERPRGIDGGSRMLRHGAPVPPRRARPCDATQDEAGEREGHRPHVFLSVMRRTVRMVETGEVTGRAPIGRRDRRRDGRGGELLFTRSTRKHASRCRRRCPARLGGLDRQAAEIAQITKRMLHARTHRAANGPVRRAGMVELRAIPGILTIPECRILAGPILDEGEISGT